MISRLVLSISLCIFIAVGSTAHAGVEPGNLCKEKKAKEAGAKAFGLLKALGKNLKKPDPIRLAWDISKARSKFTKGFEKAEATGGCETTEDSDAIEAKVDALVFEMVANIDPTCGDGVTAGPDEECDGAEDAACPGRCIAPGNGGATCGDNTVNGGDQCTCAPEECDGTAGDACPGLCQPNCRCPEAMCGNGVVEVGEECEPPCSEDPPCASGEICGVTCQCVPKEPCDCDEPNPTLLDLTVGTGSGICGELKNAAGYTLLELACGYSYVGCAMMGAFTFAAAPLPVCTNTHNVECCYGTTLALTNTTPPETGSTKTCTGAGCFFGAPVPFIANPSPLSVCSIYAFDGDAHGSMDCSTGGGIIHYPISSDTYLVGDGLRRRCDEDAGDNRGRRCGPKCSGGSIPGKSCTHDSNCSGGCSEDGGRACLDDTDCTGTCTNPPPGTCNQHYDCLPGECLWDFPDHCDSDSGEKAGLFCFNDSDCAPGTCLGEEYYQPCPICNPVTLKCNGGPNDGLACAPQPPDIGPTLPTSQDCPPPSALKVGETHMPYSLTTGTSSLQADDGQFCPYCRDVEIEESLCFEGDPDLYPGPGQRGCPDSSIISDCKPYSYHHEIPGADISGCGAPAAIPCASDTDCYAPYETCEQRNPGAFNCAGAVRINMWGAPAGNISDRSPHAATLSGHFCVLSTFDMSDAGACLPGPGAVSLVGEFLLRP